MSRGDRCRPRHARRASRARQFEAFRPALVTELGFLAYESGREARRPKGQRGRLDLTGVPAARPENPRRVPPVSRSNAASPATASLPRNPSTSSAASPTARGEALSCDGVWNDSGFPLPFTVTIPVSFERSRRSCESAGASTCTRFQERVGLRHDGHIAS